MNLGAIIRKARQGNEQFKTMKALADSLEISLEHVRRIENGQSFPSGKLLEKIIKCLTVGEEVRKKCWLALAKRQLDPVTLSHVYVSADSLDHRTARVALTVLGQYYDVSEEDEEFYLGEIRKTLKAKG